MSSAGEAAGDLAAGKNIAWFKPVPAMISAAYKWTKIFK